MRGKILIGAIVAAISTMPASAAPGLDSKVYGTRITAGSTELESRYGRLTGGSDSGESALVFEVAHGFSDRFYGAVLTTIEHQPSGGSSVASIGLEGIYRLGTIPGIGVEVAIYGEYEIALYDEPHNIELKALFEKQVGGLDARINLVAQRRLRSGAPLEFGYAASVDHAVIGDEVRLGFEAFGDLGSSDHFGGRQSHFIGPAARFEIEHLPFGGDLEIGAGYLFAVGAAHDSARGQARLALEWETHF